MVLGEPSHVGYTVHRLSERLDDGDIFLRKWCPSPPDFNAPWLYVASYKSALDALARRIGDASCGNWPLEDDFAGIALPTGRPLWRMTLTRVWSLKIRALVGAY